MATKTQRRELTEDQVAKVRCGLVLIEEAQGLLRQACEQLCSVPGFATQWTNVGREHDRVKGLWHQVNYHRMRFQADDSRT